MQKNILKFSLFFLSLIVAFFFWHSVNRAITVADSSVWLIPMLWFSLFYVVYCLEFVLTQEKIWPTLSVVLGIVSSFIFAPNIWHFLILLFSMMLLHISYLQIRRDLRLNVKVSLPKTLRTGKAFFILALALVVSSQYYFQAKSAGLLKLPIFDAGVILDNKLVQGVLSELNPNLKKLENKELTVDELILENFEESQAGAGEGDLLDLVEESQFVSLVNLRKIEELREQKILEAGRKQLGKMANKELTGSEKVSVVLTEIMNQKIKELISPDYSDGGFPTVLVGMALILFLTVLSLGSFLVRILVHLISFIFWIFIFGKIVTIKKVPVEMEVIEQS